MGATMNLEDWPLSYVRVSCAKCGREGRMAKDKLLDRFGHDRDMFAVRVKLTESACERPDKKQPCMAILTDALLVQAITAENDDDVIDKNLIPEARKFK